jgi:hypothetical protein
MSQLKTVSLLSLLFVAIGLFSTTAHMQSGRRQNKPAPAAPIPTPTPDPTPKPKEERKSELGFFVGIDRGDAFTYFPLSFYSAVLSGCSERLSRGSSAKVSTSDRLTRSDAIKKAKTEKTTYVVYLRLTSFQMISGTQQTSIPDAEIEYTVFAPLTAKVVTQGRGYQGVNRRGPVVVQPPGRSSILYQEQMLRRAAEDIGDRILKALHLASGNFFRVNSFHSHRKAAQ